MYTMHKAEVNCKGPKGIIKNCTNDTKYTTFMQDIKHIFRMSTAIFLEGCNKNSVLCVTVHVITHCESCTNGVVRLKMKLNEYGR
jgi:hypothetical protein